MPTEHTDKTHHTGLYERAVHRITEWVKPRLHETTEEFVEKSVDTYAKDEPQFARMIAFEVKRRGDGAGLTQDVAEPLLWTGVKTAAALAIAVITKSMENKKIKMIGYGAALGILLNNGVELFRLKARYTAGLQGSLEMAKDRWHSIQETGIDPFGQQTGDREINHGKFTQALQEKPPITATSLMEQADKTSPQTLPGR